MCTFHVEIQHCGFLPGTAAVKICTCNGFKVASFPGFPSFLFFSLCSVYTEAEEQQKIGKVREHLPHDVDAK